MNKKIIFTAVALGFECMSAFGMEGATCIERKDPIRRADVIGRDRTVLIIGINQATIKYLPAGLRERGFEPIFILDATKTYEGDSRLALETCEVYRTDINSPECVAKVFTDNPGIVARAGNITSFVDPLFPVVRLMAERFGFKGPDPAIPRLSEKAELYRVLPEFCPRHLAFPAAEAETTDFSGFSADKDWILKPSLSALAAGITVLPRSADLRTAVPAAIKASGLKNALSQTWILQERIPGRLVSLEGFVREGAVTFLGFSVRARIRLSESLNEFPGDEHLSPAVSTRCRDAIQALVKRTGYRDGYFHCEFLVEGDTSYIIDGNIGRIAGAAVAEQIALSFGLEPQELLCHVALLSIQPEAVEVPFKVKPDQALKTCFIAYGIPRGAVLGSVLLPELGFCKHTQFASIGGTIVPMGTSDGAAIGGGSGLKDDVLKVLKGIVIHTDQGALKPAFTLHDEM